MTIGEKILQCRKKAGMSQEGLADSLNISRQAISRWETGEATPDTDKIIQLSKLFGVSTDYLLLEDLEEVPTKDLEAVEAARRQAEEDRKQAAEEKEERLLEETRKKWDKVKLWAAVLLVIVGAIGIGAAMIAAGIYAPSLTEWYTTWGKYGTALFSEWCMIPFVAGLVMIVIGGALLWSIYREDTRLMRKLERPESRQGLEEIWKETSGEDTDSLGMKKAIWRPEGWEEKENQ